MSVASRLVNSIVPQRQSEAAAAVEPSRSGTRTDAFGATSAARQSCDRRVTVLEFDQRVSDRSRFRDPSRARSSSVRIAARIDEQRGPIGLARVRRTCQRWCRRQMPGGPPASQTQPNAQMSVRLSAPGRRSPGRRCRQLTRERPGRMTGIRGHGRWNSDLAQARAICVTLSFTPRRFVRRTPQTNIPPRRAASPAAVLTAASSAPSNSYRSHVWTHQLPRVADKRDMSIHVSHFRAAPAIGQVGIACSRSSRSTGADALRACETVINLIGNTTTEVVSSCVRLDRRRYPTAEDPKKELREPRSSPKGFTASGTTSSDRMEQH